MFKYMKLLVIVMLLPVLTGCAGFMAYIKDLQKQSVDDFDKRSTEFRPRYQFKAPGREDLSVSQQKLVGAPPPPKGVVLLDGTRYFSANGHVCHLFKDTRYQSPVGTKSACYINGKWVLAAPVLNTRQAKP